MFVDLRLSRGDIDFHSIIAAFGDDVFEVLEGACFFSHHQPRAFLEFMDLKSITSGC